MEAPAADKVTFPSGRLARGRAQLARTPADGRPLRSRGAALAAVAIPVLIVLAAGWHYRWTTDDAFIDFRVVHNVLGGHGPVFNVGDRVEAYTSPLWVGLLTLLTWITRAPVEWVAVVLGLAATATGFACAGRAGLLLVRHSAHDDRALVLPFGVLVLAVLPPVWDFATSGLESGAEFAWMGAGFLLLSRIAVREQAGAPARLRRWAPALFLGLGPLIRPEFGLFAAVWVAVLLALTWRGWRRALGLAAVALAPAIVYEVFRMGYFAAVLPSTAMAKEAGTAQWGAGWNYLLDTFKPYLLVLPVAVLLLWMGRRLWRGEMPRRTTLLSVATAGVAVLYGIYVVRVGGDFMHARMLLPAIFVLALPVAMIPLAARRDLLAWGAVAAWSVVCLLALRVHTVVSDSTQVQDERSFWVSVAEVSNPVTLADHDHGRGPVWVGHWFRDAVTLDPGVYLWAGTVPVEQRNADGATRAGLQQPVVATMLTLGQLGDAAGPDVFAVDRHGLADSIAARVYLDPTGRVGHQKLMPDSWVLARFADPASLTWMSDAELADIAAARRALTCNGPLHDVITATTAPLAPGQFFSNLAHAWSYTSLRFSPDPRQAVLTLCR